MEGEMRNFAMVWSSVVASLCYCHAAGKIFKPGPTRLFSVLPVIILFLVLPLNLRTIFLGGLTSFFVAWLATFKLLLFAFGHGPLSSDPPLQLRHFIPLACFPIKIQNDKSFHKQQKSLLNYGVKALVYSTVVPVFLNKASIHPKVFLFLYTVYMYTALEIILAGVAAAVRASLGWELESQFDEPFLSTSLQNFWGRRWNIMVSDILRPTIYLPARALSTRLIGRRWAPVPAVIPAFLASGLMHELIFYNIGRASPKGDVMCFFLLHGVCVAAEIGVKKAVGGKWRLPAAVSGLLALGFFMVTSVWLFMPAQMRFEADVMAHREIVAFLMFVKEISIGLRLDRATDFALSTFTA